MTQRMITFWRIIHTGIVNFMRNVTLAVAAMAVMVVTLTIVLFSLITNATFENTIAQITNKISVSVYLNDTTTDAQAKTARQTAQAANRKSTGWSISTKPQALQSYVEQNNEQPELGYSGRHEPATRFRRPSRYIRVTSTKSRTSKTFLVTPANQEAADSRLAVI